MDELKYCSRCATQFKKELVEYHLGFADWYCSSCYFLMTEHHTAKIMKMVQEILKENFQAIHIK